MKMKKIVSILSLFALFVSCGETEDKIWDPTTGQTLAYFATNSGVLGVPFNSTTTQTFKVNVNTLSTVDRTVVLEVDTANTNVAVENYSFNPNVTIPANGYIGDLVITGTDTPGLTTAPKLLVLIVKSVSDGGVVSKAKLTLTVQQICPLPVGFFTGNYLLTETTPFVDGPTLEHNTVRPIVAANAANVLERSFMSYNYPTYCSTTRRNFRFQLVCGEVVIPAGNDSNCTCGTPLLFTAPTVNGTFNPTSDATATLNFTNDTNSSCSPPVQTSYTLTKQ